MGQSRTAVIQSFTVPQRTAAKFLLAPKRWKPAEAGDPSELLLYRREGSLKQKRYYTGSCRQASSFIFARGQEQIQRKCRRG